MKTLNITHFFDEVKKEVTDGSDDATRSDNTGMQSEIKIEQECYIKEEVDIAWDETNSIFKAGNDSAYSSENRISMFNVRVVVDKLPEATVQQYLKSRTNNIEMHQNSTISVSDSYTVQREELPGKIDKNLEYVHFNSQFYWKICTTCNKKYEVVPAIHKTHACKKCKTRLLYECKKCHKQVLSISGIKYHFKLKYKCFECDYKTTIKRAVLKHVRYKHPTMTSQMHSRIKIIECENVRNDLEKARPNCSRCGSKFEVLTELMRHIQICTGNICKTDNESQRLAELKSVTDRIIPFCDECDKELLQKNSFERSKNIRKMNCRNCKSIIHYKCAECKRQYTSRNGVISHIRAAHITKQEYKCSECDFKSHVISRLTLHYSKMHVSDSEIHECKKCSMKFNNRYDLTRHSYQCGLQSQYNCDHCSYTSRWKDGLVRHIQSRHFHFTEARVECPKCKSTFKNKFCLSAHKSLCGKLSSLQCDCCSFKTTYKQHLKRHLLRMHSSDGKRECPKCKKIQRNEYCLKVHLKHCELKDHFQCKLCSFKTRYRVNLREHTVRLHQKNNDASNGESEKFSGIKANYECDHCLLKCKTKGDLYKHIVKRHLQEKNVVCSRCKATFQNNVLLNQHLLNCGLKPYLHCKKCPFKTYLKGQLNVHVDRKHMSIACPKCNRKFRKDYLKYHMQSRGCKKRFDDL